MARKDKLSNRERELRAFTHCVDYLVDFYKRYQRPRRQLPLLAEAIKEVSRIQMKLEAEYQQLVLYQSHGNANAKVESK